MRYLKFIVLLIVIFSLTNCEKQNELVNKKTDAQIVGFVTEKCYCCWGWVIKVGTETIKAEQIANFLIKNDLNIIEGLRLIARALKSDPDSYKYIDCKGWGFYKQGRIIEALEFLEKSWELIPVFRYYIYLHLDATKKAVAGLNNF
jgi:hypothetical protein